MIYTLRIILDSIFPPTKHELRLRNVTAEQMFYYYKPGTIQGVTFLSEYHIPVIQSAVAACKFEHNYKAADLLAALLHTHLKTLKPVNTLLIPIPLSKKRLRKRGYNQVSQVIEKLPLLQYQCKIEPTVLIRSRHTEAQTSLHRKDRLININGAFSVKGKNLLANAKRIIICDDVITTGATLKEARATLAPHLPPHTEIICLAWAH